MDTSNSSSSTSILDVFYLCTSSAMGTWTYTAWFVVYMCFSPLFLLVIFVGITKWWKQCSGDSAGVSLSHSDVITLHMMAMQILSTVAAMLYMYGLHAGKALMSNIGTAILTLTMSGETYFHCLTCGERYLAVVHPITYLHLKKTGGVTIRNVSIGAAWLLSFIYVVVMVVIPNFWTQMITTLLLVLVAIVLMTFCSISALCALIRPRPGDGHGNRKWIDQSKRSAFITVTAILVIILVRMVQLLVFNFWFLIVNLEPCVLTMTALWLSLPNSLVLPLLFLHRNGKLPTCA